MDEATQKGLATRQRRWEARNEKRRLKALEEEAKAAKIKAEDEKYMKEAIKQAKKAAKIGDVPIGCVLVKDGQIIARGYNRRNADKTVLSHAEVTSIKKACKKEGDWRLEDCTLYVTLEPCPMCAGAIVQARIPRVVIGSMNSKAGCAGSVLNLLKEPGFNHQAPDRYRNIRRRLFRNDVRLFLLSCGRRNIFRELLKNTLITKVPVKKWQYLPVAGHTGFPEVLRIKSEL